MRAKPLHTGPSLNGVSALRSSVSPVECNPLNYIIRSAEHGIDHGNDVLADASYQATIKDVLHMTGEASENLRVALREGNLDLEAVSQEFLQHAS